MPDDSHELLATMQDIRNWVRAAAYPSVKKLLEDALPDTKSRQAYQMTNGTNSVEAIRKACGISPNTLVALQSRCVALGLMTTSDLRKIKLFDLGDFGLLGEEATADAGLDAGGNGRKNTRIKR